MRRSLATRAAAELELRRRRAARPPLWSPYSGGPQERAYLSPADVTGYGGAAGGGKTDLGLGLALTSHRDSLIFRRVYPQLKGIVKRSRELIGGRGRYNGQDKVYRLDDGREIEFGAVQYEDSVEAYRGRPHDLIVFDEATEFTLSQVQFLMGWLRTTVPGQRCRVLMPFNPPTSADGEWIIGYFGPWLDEAHPNPALPGELRWYTTVDGVDVERLDGTPFEHKGETLRPLSRTFFPARLSDNPALAATSYGATLQALPEPLRSQLLYGDFRAGRKEDAWQCIPTAWIKAAMDRWRSRSKPPGPATASGLDVAHGGADKTVKADRYADWFDELKKWPGAETPTGNAAAVLAARGHHPDTPLNVDAIGYGASAAERLRERPPVGFGLRARPVNVGEASRKRDRSGRWRIVNLRAEGYWMLREALDPDNAPTLCLPPDPELLADLSAPRYELTTTGIKLESKDDIKARLRRSPDCGDAVALAMVSPATLQAY